MAKRLGWSAMAAVALLAGAEASAAPPSPISLHCTQSQTWACGDGKTCKAVAGTALDSYTFDLLAMTYQAPDDRGAITDYEIDDSGFTTFVLGGGRRYVHKDTHAGATMTSFLYLSPQDMRELRCNARYAETRSEAQAGDRRPLVGHYYLSGVMETGSELLLRSDGSFAWFMSYGAMDQEAEGTWRVDGDAVLLDARASGGTEPAFRQLRLQMDQEALLLNGAGKGRYKRHP
jgi:hypothetical protein